MDIKFTMTASEIELQFLDTLMGNIGETFDIDLFVKPTDHNNLLKFDNFHPRPKVKSLPYSHLQRVKRNVQDPTTMDQRLAEMGNKFIK